MLSFIVVMVYELNLRKLSIVCFIYVAVRDPIIASERVDIAVTGLTPPHLYARPKSGLRIPMPYVVVVFVFIDLRSEVVVRFVDICKIVDHHHLNDKSVFSFGTPVSSTNKSHRHYITEILLKVALNTITPSLFTI
jgi:hypothetical protein